MDMASYNLLDIVRMHGQVVLRAIDDIHLGKVIEVSYGSGDNKRQIRRADCTPYVLDDAIMKLAADARSQYDGC